MPDVTDAPEKSRISPTARGRDPASLSLGDMLDLIDSAFGIEAIMQDKGQDRVETYYRQSRLGYEKLYNDFGAMHLALNDTDSFDEAGYYAQAEAVSQAIAERGAARVLELGAGLAFNARHLARLYPGVEFVALDLMAQHVTRARQLAKGIANLNLVQASFDPIPADLGRFDVIFGVETLCHAADPARVARSIAARANPGARFVMFDPVRKGPLGDYPRDLARATGIYEMTTAVTQGFTPAGTWERALGDAGFTNMVSTDLARQALPGLNRLRELSVKFLTTRKYRMAGKLLPKYMVRNAAAGLLGPYVYFADSYDIEEARGPLAYRRISATLPG